MHDPGTQDAAVFKELREQREWDRKEKGSEEKSPWKGIKHKGKGDNSQ